MSDLRLLEVDYDTAPETGDVPYYTGSNWVPTSFLTLFNALLPVGVYLPYGGGAAPSGWLLCEGQAVSRTDYADLFNVLGETYGAGDGSTTFNIPDLRGKAPYGVATSGTGSTRGGSFGSMDHTHTVPAHYHGMGSGADLAISASGSHTHTSTSMNMSESSAASGASGNHIVSNNAGGTATFTGTININSNTHTHASGDITGRIGLVTGGVNGNSAMTSGTGNPPGVAGNFIIWTGGINVSGGLSGYLMGITGLTYP